MFFRSSQLAWTVVVYSRTINEILHYHFIKYTSNTKCILSPNLFAIPLNWKHVFNIRVERVYVTYIRIGIQRFIRRWCRVFLWTQMCSLICPIWNGCIVETMDRYACIHSISVHLHRRGFTFVSMLCDSMLSVYLCVRVWVYLTNWKLLCPSSV